MGTRACPHGSALAAGVAVRLGSIFTRCPVLGARRGEERNRPRNPRVRRWRARRWRVGDRGVCSRGETGRRRGRPRVARVRGGGGGAVGGRGEGSRASATGGLAINKLLFIYITGAISATVWRPHDARVGICHHHHAHTTPPSSLHHSDRVPGGTRWGRGGRPVPPGAQSRERRRGCTELGTAAKIQKCPFFFSFFSNHNHLSPFFASSHSIYIQYIIFHVEGSLILYTVRYVHTVPYYDV